MDNVFEALQDKWLTPEIDEGALRLKVQDFYKKGVLFSEILKRRSEIAKTLSQFESLRYQRPSFLQDFKIDTLTYVSAGRGGTYTVEDEAGVKRWVIKPNDEDPLCLNNPGGAATPFNDYMRPIYQSAFTEALCYDVAKILKLSSVTPEIGLMMIENHLFYDIADGMDEVAVSLIGEPVKRKLCSVQRYLPQTRELREFSNPHIDQSALEKCLLFTLIIGDVDGNPGNFRVDKDGLLYKVDNTLTFTPINEDISHGLGELIGMQKPLSKEGRKLLLELPTEKIIEKMRYWKKPDNCVEAFEERAKVLQKLARERVNLAEITLR